MGASAPYLVMAKIDKPSLASRIDAIEIPQERRPHLGASMLGHNCKRYLWYSFHWAYENHVHAKLNRIFRIGDATEDLIVADLARVGMPVTDNQVRVVGYLGHGGGSIDGRIGDSLFEAKSMNVSNFNKVKKQGVKAGFPTYYTQVQYYMGKLGLDTCIFVVMNKNTQELYIETIDFDGDKYAEAQATEKAIIDGDLEDFKRIGMNASWHECRFCSALDICQLDIPFQVNCRTCEHSLATLDGMWVCEKKGQMLDMKQQLEACKFYKR